MKKNKSQLLITAAMAGMLGLGTTLMTSSPTEAAGADKGHCVGANACKGTSGCKTAKNECAGKNGCKGKGFVEKTKAECDAMKKKNKNIKFEAITPMEEKQS